MSHKSQIEPQIAAGISRGTQGMRNGETDGQEEPPPLPSMEKAVSLIQHNRSSRASRPLALPAKTAPSFAQRPFVHAVSRFLSHVTSALPYRLSTLGPSWAAASRNSLAPVRWQGSPPSLPSPPSLAIGQGKHSISRMHGSPRNPHRAALHCYLRTRK